MHFFQEADFSSSASNTSYNFRSDLKKEHKKHLIKFQIPPYSILQTPRYSIQLNADHHPYLWTENLSDCLAIGFISENGIELYHSSSEHIENEYIFDILSGTLHEKCTNVNFIKAIYKFIKNITDTANLTIVLGYGKHEHPNLEIDIDHIIFNVNKCIDYINLKKNLQLRPISERNFKLCEVARATFYLNQQGHYGSVQDMHRKSLLELKQLIEDVCHHYSSKTTDEKFDLPSEIATITKKLAETCSDYLELLNDIKVDASKKLVKTTENYLKKIYIKIIAWDTFLNKPSEKLLNCWLKNTNFKLDETLKKEALMPEIFLDSQQLNSTNESTFQQTNSLS